MRTPGTVIPGENERGREADDQEEDDKVQKGAGKSVVLDHELGGFGEYPRRAGVHDGNLKNAALPKRFEELLHVAHDMEPRHLRVRANALELYQAVGALVLLSLRGVRGCRLVGRQGGRRGGLPERAPLG